MLRTVNLKNEKSKAKVGPDVPQNEYEPSS